MNKWTERAVLGIGCFIAGAVGLCGLEKYEAADSLGVKPTEVRALQTKHPPKIGSISLADLSEDEPKTRFFGDPFAEIRQMQKDVREHMMRQFKDFDKVPDPFQRFIKTRNFNLGMDQVSRHEDDRYVYYDISVKGLAKDKLNIKVENGQIDISGEIQKKTTDDGMSTTFVSTFHQSISVPEDVDVHNVEMIREQDKIVVKFPKV